MQINIKKVAEEKNISLYRIAKIIRMPQQTVYSWANGRTQPSYENMDKLCTALNCTMGELFIRELVNI